MTDLRTGFDRLAVDAQRGLDSKVGTFVTAAESVDATQKFISISELRNDHCGWIWNSGYEEETLAESRATERVVREFLAGAGALLTAGARVG
ncbi:hypothetical protein ABZ707_19955 [Streptomyces sp. NPDC006923]|uniref:hypothetical protein n=1 Tax=Streptomyces sp. NPDC006923 TaxID=3155355 RepID=UPI0033C95978